MIEIIACQKDDCFNAALSLVNDYRRWLNIDLCFQKIDEELANFSTMYGGNDGVFLLASREEKLAGGVGLRLLEKGICEMKRLYVYDQFKGMGIGEQLCARLIKEAKTRHYQKMRLDTLNHMHPAISLYKKLGFKNTHAYCFNPDPQAKYMELDLHT